MTDLPPVWRRADALTSGITDSELRVLLRSGALVRLDRGRYVAAEGYEALDRDDQYRLRVRAVATRSPQLVVSHASAAALRGLPSYGLDQTHVHLSRCARGGQRVSTGRWVHANDLSDQDWSLVAGLRMTTSARTVLDLALSQRRLVAVVAADAAVQRTLVTPTELTQTLDRLRRHKGAPQARRSLREVDGRSESPGETLLRLGLADQGLPELELQLTVRDELGRFCGRADLGYVEHGVLVEFDGKVKYAKLVRDGQSLLDVVLAEKAREQRLTELGWLVIRVVWSELQRPDHVAARIRAACSARSDFVLRGGLRGSIERMTPVHVAV